MGCFTLSLEIAQWPLTVILSHQILSTNYVSHVKVLRPLSNHSIWKHAWFSWNVLCVGCDGLWDWIVVHIRCLWLHDELYFIFDILYRLLCFLSFVAGYNWRRYHTIELNFGVFRWRLTERWVGFSRHAWILEHLLPSAFLLQSWWRYRSKILGLLAQLFAIEYNFSRDNRRLLLFLGLWLWIKGWRRPFGAVTLSPRLTTWLDLFLESLFGSCFFLEKARGLDRIEALVKGLGARLQRFTQSLFLLGLRAGQVGLRGAG